MVRAELGLSARILDLSANVIQSYGSKAVAAVLLQRSEQPLNLGPLGCFGR